MSLLDFFLLPNRLLESLTAIDQVLSSINQRLTQMSDQLTALTEQVEANATVTGSAITLLQGLKQQLDDAIASSDPDALADLSERLGSQTQALADAVSANTPAA